MDKSEIGESFFVELIWSMSPQNCLLQVQETGGGEGPPLCKTVSDDGLFNGAPFHAFISSLDVIVVTASKGQTCEIDASKDDFLVVARAYEVRFPRTAHWLRPGLERRDDLPGNHIFYAS